MLKLESYLSYFRLLGLVVLFVGVQIFTLIQGDDYILAKSESKT